MCRHFHFSNPEFLANFNFYQFIISFYLVPHLICRHVFSFSYSWMKPFIILSSLRSDWKSTSIKDQRNKNTWLICQFSSLYWKWNQYLLANFTANPKWLPISFTTLSISPIPLQYGLHIYIYLIVKLNNLIKESFILASLLFHNTETVELLNFVRYLAYNWGENWVSCMQACAIRTPSLMNYKS